MIVRKYDPLDVARRYLYVREVAGNHGLRVNGIQRWSGGQDGDAWCAEFLCFVLDECYQGRAPFRTGLCENVRLAASAKAWFTLTPVPGDIYLRIRNGRAHHTGFVTQWAYGQGHFGSISGNTSDVNESDGDGVYEHDVVALGGDIFIHLPDPLPE